MKKDTYQRELERQKEEAYEAARKYNRAQDRLNRAAVAWAHIYAETIKDPWKYSDRLMRAVRAFQKASAVRVEIYAVRAKKAGGR